MTTLLKMTYNFINPSLILLLSSAWLIPFSFLKPTEVDVSFFLLWMGGNILGMTCIARDFSMRWSAEQLLWHAVITPVFAFFYAWEAIDGWLVDNDE